MTNNVIQFSQYSLDDFLGLLEERISRAVEKVQIKDDPNKDREFYTRKETASKLQVSYATLHNWAKDGVLTPQKIGSRVYYSKAEVSSKLT